MALATIHCPAWREPGGGSHRQPLQRSRMTASSEPVIQGNGQPIRLASHPPSAPISGALAYFNQRGWLPGSGIGQLGAALGAVTTPERQRDHRGHQCPQANGDWAGKQNAKVAVGDRQCAAQVAFHHVAEDEAQQ